MSDNKWIPALRIRGGHRFFTEAKTGRVAIADESGATPERTEDGVLYLDRTAPIRLHGTGASLALYDTDGKACTTPVSPSCALRVAAKFGLMLKTSCGAYFRAQEQGR